MSDLPEYDNDDWANDPWNNGDIPEDLYYQEFTETHGFTPDWKEVEEE